MGVSRRTSGAGLRRTLPGRRRVGWVMLVGAFVVLAGCTAGGGGGDEVAHTGPPAGAAWFRAGEGRIEARYAGDQGFRAAGPTVDVTLMALDVEGERTSAVCVERHQWLAPDQAHAARPAEQVGVDAGGRAAWLAANHGSVPAPMERDEELAAVQLAVWHVVGDLSLDEIADDRLAARVDQLVAASDGKVSDVGPSRIQLEVVAVDGGEAVTVRLLGDGEPMAGAPVHVEAPGVDETVTTGADGTARVPIPSGGEVTARWQGTAPAGTVVEPADEGGQALMSTEPVTLVRTGGVELEAGSGRPAA